MALYCSWSVLCLCILLGCRRVRRRCGDLRRIQTVARSVEPPCPTQEEKRLSTCWSPDAATAIITVVYHWLLPKHLVALPPTPRRCYRSTSNASQTNRVLIMLILALFLPGSRAELVTTNKDNGSENNVADGSQVAEVSYTSVWHSLVRVARKGALRALPCSNDMALKGSTSVSNGRGRPPASSATQPWPVGTEHDAWR